MRENHYWIWIIGFGFGYFEAAFSVVTRSLRISFLKLGREISDGIPLDSSNVNMALGDVCRSAHHHHRGPLIVVVVGMGFGVVGAIPVAVNSAVGATNSGTIIGVGFIGFGLLLVLPGLVWCVVQRLVMLKKCCRCQSRRDSVLHLEETAAPVLM